jgi:hypothetical protein
MKNISYGMNLLGLFLTLGIGLFQSFSLETLGFLLLIITPYFFAMLLTKWSKNHIASMVTAGTSSILALGGVFLIIDAMYIHPDAQSGLVFPVVAVYQWAILLVISIPLYIINKKV